MCNKVLLDDPAQLGQCRKQHMPEAGLTVLLVHTCHFHSFSVSSLKGPIDARLAEVAGLPVDANTLCDGVTRVLQPFAFCFLLCVHHPPHHLHPLDHQLRLLGCPGEPALQFRVELPKGTCTTHHGENVSSHGEPRLACPAASSTCDASVYLSSMWTCLPLNLFTATLLYVASVHEAQIAASHI